MQTVPRDGRAIYVIPTYDVEKNEWVIFAEIEKLKYVRVVARDCESGVYLSKTAQDPGRDLEFPMGTFLIQQFSFPSVSGTLSRIASDIHNLACVLEKFHLISLRPQQQRKGATFLLESEVEYLMLLVRSMYDLVQKFAKRAGALVSSLDDPKKRIFSALPDSFADISLSGQQPRSAAEIQGRWKLAPVLATFYETEAPTFLRIKAVRDGIAHHGRDVSIIFDAEQGMAVSVKRDPWSSFGLWQSQALLPNSLGSLRALLAHIILNAVDLPTRFVRSYCSCVRVPEAISPDFRCFLRNPFGRHLLSLNAYLSQPWERADRASNSVPPI